MEQAKIEQLAFLYLCSEHDKRLLLKKEKMQLADFDRLTYLIYHLGFKEYHTKVWMEFTGDFKKEWECLECTPGNRWECWKYRQYKIRNQTS